MKVKTIVFATAACMAMAGVAAPRWSVEKANAWAAANPWWCGVNYIPANAINYTAMWDKTSFSPDVIRRELKLMTGLGMNCVRFVMQYKVYEEDPAYFLKTLDTFLALCDSGPHVTLNSGDGIAFENAQHRPVETTGGGGGEFVIKNDGITGTNGLKGNIQIAGGSKIDVTVDGNTIRISYNDGKPEDEGVSPGGNCDDHPGGGDGVTVDDDTGFGGGVVGGGGWTPGWGGVPAGIGGDCGGASCDCD